MEKEALNKMILFSLVKDSDSTSQNGTFIKKNCFSLRGKAAFIGEKTRWEWPPVVEEKVPYKIWFRLSFNNGFHQHKICSKKQSTRQKIYFHSRE